MKTLYTLCFALVVSLASAQPIVKPRPNQTAPTGPNTRFKHNVPSLVVKGNPWTMLFGYVDGGVEYRTHSKGWVLMTHSFFRGPSSVQSTNVATASSTYYEELNTRLRLEFSHRWYRDAYSSWGRDIRKYTALYIATGYVDYSWTDNLQPGNGGYVPVGPLNNDGRIDMIVGAQFGRERGLRPLDSPRYWESSWKVGYNLTTKMPVIGWGFRYNFKVN